MEKRDYYQVLGISRNASDDEIKKAYRRLVMKHHPDKNPGDSQSVERMKEINEAYAILTDPVKRRKYDRFGHRGLEGYTQEDIFGGMDFGSIFNEMGLRDIFGGLFGSFGFGTGNLFDDLFSQTRASGGRVRELQARRGADLQLELEIDLEEAFRGGEKQIRFPRTELCPGCQGTGAARGGLSICRECQGRGQVVYEQRSGWSVFQQITTCPHCHGQGKMITSHCPKCRGKGAVEIEREVSLRIPKGADSGQAIRIPGEGETGERGLSGDLYIKLKVKKHPVFTRRGANIYVTQPVTLTQAMLGGRVYGIPCLDGNIDIEIPPETSSGTMVKLDGRGMPMPDDERGDLYVTIEVVLPKGLTDEEKALLRQFERMRACCLDPLFLSQCCFGLLALPAPRSGEDK